LSLFSIYGSDTSSSGQYKHHVAQPSAPYINVS
jgi:hypothetical protein